jgi:exopolyphosphatase / guanosine-5'-triphosphate,3'-diphosphate pyrophosphatase
MRPVRVAAIDCGTNSLRLLVADVDPGAGRLTDVDRRMEIVRLGQGVDSTGRLAPEALERTLRALRGYARIIADRSTTAVRMVATSATRDAANAADFVHGVSGVLGLEPEVLSGEEEAYLSFVGATAEFDGGSASPDGGPYLVVDIGGGSTEFVLGDGQPPAEQAPAERAPAEQAPAGRASAGLITGAAGPAGVTAGAAGVTAGAAGVSAVSVDIGCVRLTERHLHSDPPRPAEISAAAADIDAALDAVAGALPVTAARTLVGLAGSVTTVAGLALGLGKYDSARIHHARVSAEQVALQTRRLLSQTRAERAALGVMHPGRVDVIGGGAMVLDQIMQRFGFGEVLASEHDILDGIAWSLAAGVRR